MSAEEKQIPVKGILFYSREKLVEVARIIKPEGELTNEDLEDAKQYFYDLGKDTEK